MSLLGVITPVEWVTRRHSAQQQWILSIDTWTLLTWRRDQPQIVSSSHYRVMMRRVWGEGEISHIQDNHHCCWYSCVPGVCCSLLLWLTQEHVLSDSNNLHTSLSTDWCWDGWSHHLWCLVVHMTVMMACPWQTEIWVWITDQLRPCTAHSWAGTLLLPPHCSTLSSHSLLSPMESLVPVWLSVDQCHTSSWVQSCGLGSQSPRVHVQSQLTFTVVTLSLTVSCPGMRNILLLVSRHVMEPCPRLRHTHTRPVFTDQSVESVLEPAEAWSLLVTEHTLCSSRAVAAHRSQWWPWSRDELSLIHCWCWQIN